MTALARQECMEPESTRNGEKECEIYCILSTPQTNPAAIHSDQQTHIRYVDQISHPTHPRASARRRINHSECAHIEWSRANHIVVHVEREQRRDRTVSVLVEEAEGLLELGDLVVGELIRHAAGAVVDRWIGREAASTVGAQARTRMGAADARANRERPGAFCGVASGGIFPAGFIQRPTVSSAKRGR